MGTKSILSKPFAWLVSKQTSRMRDQAAADQDKLLLELLQTAKDTRFGKDHNFATINSYAAFKQQVPVQDYEGLKTYVELMKQGDRDVLWPGKPSYLCKTSGTTSGTKFIPLTRVSLQAQIRAARNALLAYIAETGKSKFTDGKMIFLQGNPQLEVHQPSGIPFGRLSGIVANYVPGYLQKNRLPSFETNSIEDWETKLDAIVDETINEDMRLISGIPSWVQMYFERLLQKSGKKTIQEIFPNLSLFVYGGVNFDPYRQRFKELVGFEVPSIETYPASEGFIAYQDSQKEEGLLLNTQGGIYYEFVPANEAHDENPTRLSLAEVELGVNYALVLNTNSGLWGYSIGDTVKFVHKNPYRIKVTGRIKHYTSAFGEHVIAEEVERAMTKAMEGLQVSVAEFHVAPQVNPDSGLPYHEWFVQFQSAPKDLEQLAQKLDGLMQEYNVYYKDLIAGNVLRPLVISQVENTAFHDYMRSIGKLGGQNKVPRLANDRKIADQLARFVIQQNRH